MARKIDAKRILLYCGNGMSRRRIAELPGFGSHSVYEVCDIADARGIGYADLAELSDYEAYRLFFPARNAHEPAYEQPDWDYVHKELAKTGVTLKLLHSEYADDAGKSGGVSMGYDRFCKPCKKHAMASGLTSRVRRKPGWCMEVDWSGPHMDYVDPATGEVRRAYIFVATLPSGRYFYAEPTEDMSQKTWLLCHVYALRFFGGSPVAFVCDNLMTGVVSHPRDGEIVLNRDYEQLAAHYRCAALPGRVRAPKVIITS
jgi:transposase